MLRRGSDRASLARRSIQTYVFVQRGRWQIAAFTNTRDRPFAKTFVGRLAGWFGHRRSRGTGDDASAGGRPAA